MKIEIADRLSARLARLFRLTPAGKKLSRNVFIAAFVVTAFAGAYFRVFAIIVPAISIFGLAFWNLVLRIVIFGPYECRRCRSRLKLRKHMSEEFLRAGDGVLVPICKACRAELADSRIPCAYEAPDYAHRLEKQRFFEKRPKPSCERQETANGPRRWTPPKI